MRLLDVWVAAGDDGPVVFLPGEADLTCAGMLRDALAAQLPGGARCVVVDLSQLRFIDSAALRELILAARALKAAGGDLVLSRPQPAVARVFKLHGIDQVLTVRGEMTPEGT